MAYIGYIQVTRRCNQQCIICSNPPQENKLTLEKACELVDTLIEDGIEGINFSGGEPTIWEPLPGLIKYATENNVACRITTNAQKTSDKGFLEELLEAGLRQIHISIYSHKKDVQDHISQNPGSLDNIISTLENLKSHREVYVSVNIAIFKQNVDHLAQTVNFIINNFPYVEHFSFNNLDPNTTRVREHPEVIPRLNDMELPLFKAFNLIDKTGRTFRISRVPLCYMAGFEHCSMETRKIVKQEGRSTFFLDERGKYEQTGFQHQHGECCKSCFVKEICAGLYRMNEFYFEEELYPLFISPDKIRKKILAGKD